MLKSIQLQVMLLLAFAAEKIPTGRSVAEFFRKDNGTTDDKFQAKQVTHFISKRAVNFDNGNIVDSSTAKKNGEKTFTNDMLDNDFLVTKARLLYATAADDASVVSADYSNIALGSSTALPGSIKNTQIKITQDQEAFCVGARELYEGSTSDEKWLVLDIPFKIRQKVPFEIKFNGSAAFGSTESYRVELGGVEYVQIYGSSTKKC